jgi:hypothetical protein
MKTKEYVAIGNHTSVVFTTRIAAEVYATQQSALDECTWYVQERFSYA